MRKKQELLQLLIFHAFRGFSRPHFSKTIYQIWCVFSLSMSHFFEFGPVFGGSLYICTRFFIFFYIKMDETRYR